MNNTKLKNIIENYKKHIANVQDIEAINERKERMQYYQSWTKEKIDNMTQDEFVEYIGKLWSMIVWGNKKYIADKIVEVNGFEKVKKYLVDLLYGNNDIEKRWDSFYKNIKQIGPSSMSELLSYINPEEYVICNKVTCNCFKYLEVDKVPMYNYQYTGANYKRLCVIGKEIAENMKKENIKNVNLLIVDYMFWDIVFPITKKINVDDSKDMQEEIEIEKDTKLFVHNDIINQIVEIGQWLGFESKSEVKIADGAVVDAIWQAQIGNMGKVIYAFEVQTHGSIDSLILNLQKATNNFAVQAIVAVSDEKQIEKIRKEAKGIYSIETKLKTWDYTEVMEMHDCLERSNEIINTLGLVPDSFI
ncbi:MAG: hypothetical protein HUJ68_02580 [Clostridia bacterium]|nr:hypothetical protein [Clostridia bacterium]